MRVIWSQTQTKSCPGRGGRWWSAESRKLLLLMARRPGHKGLLQVRYPACNVGDGGLSDTANRLARLWIVTLEAATGTRSARLLLVAANLAAVAQLTGPLDFAATAAAPDAEAGHAAAVTAPALIPGGRRGLGLARLRRVGCLCGRGPDSSGGRCWIRSHGAGMENPGDTRSRCDTTQHKIAFDNPLLFCLGLHKYDSTCGKLAGG